MDDILIDRGVVKGGQDYVLERVYARDNGDRIRVRIKRDSYDFQSYATADRWDGTQWQNVVRMDGVHPTMAALPSYATRDERSRNAALENLVEDLLEEVALILG